MWDVTVRYAKQKWPMSLTSIQIVLSTDHKIVTMFRVQVSKLRYTQEVKEIT
jgi:hypothetical protein